jgi:hypothetical protein
MNGKEKTKTWVEDSNSNNAQKQHIKNVNKEEGRRKSRIPGVRDQTG